MDALDWAGRTPLHVCVVERLIEPFKVLLSVPGSADVRDASAWSLLHAALVHGWREGALAVLDAGARVDVRFNPKYFLIYPEPDPKFGLKIFELPIEIAMKSGDVEMFERILEVMERDGVLEYINNYGYTALGSAIRRSNLPVIQALLSKGASPHKISYLNETALHVAVQDINILKYLLDNTKVTSSLDKLGRAPVHLAIRVRNPEAVRLLLDTFNNPRVKTEPGGNTPLHYAAQNEGSASYEAVEIILQKDLQAIHDVNEAGETPLHVAVEYKNRVLAALLLQKGAHLSTKDHDGRSVIESISHNFYEASDFFDFVFDRFIYNTEDNNFRVHVDYQVLTSGTDMSQIGVLEEFVRCGQSRALRHPLVESLLYLKWRHFLPLFYAMICVHAIFLVSFNILMVNLFQNEDMNINSTTNASSTLHASPKSGGEVAGGFHGGVPIVLTYISIFMLLVQESCYIYVKRYRYFASAESWVKLAGLVLCAAAPLAALAPGPWPRHVACAALLLAWLQDMLLVSRFPSWGYYVLMFGKVIVNMLKILVTSIFLVIGFSFCFMIQYRSAPPFDGPFAAFVKTLVMMSSEFDYEDLLGKDHDEQLQDTRTFVRLLFVMFVIFVAIILMNFMIGVAVSDLKDLNETGNIRRLEKQVELLSTLDSLVYDGVFAKWFKDKFGDRSYHLSMYTFRKNKSTWHAKCRRHFESPHQDDFQYFIQISSPTLYDAIVETARKGDHLVDTDKIDALYDAIVDRPVATDKKSEGSKQNKKVTIRLPEVITKQNEQIKSLVDNLSKVSNEIEDIKRYNESLQLQISQLSSLSTDILTSLKGIAIKCDAVHLNQNK